MSTGPDAAELIDAFRVALQEYGKYHGERHSDSTLRRFLMARDWDLSAAQDMLLAHEEWRVAEKVDDLVDHYVYEERDEVARALPRYLHKHDHDHRPIFIWNFGMTDMDRVNQITTLERLRKAAFLEHERLTRTILPSYSKRFGKDVYQVTMILDLNGATMYQFNEYRKFVSLSGKVLSQNYPEVLHKLYIINAPLLFSSIWYMVSGLLDPRTVSKITILGSDYMAVLKDVLDPQHLPSLVPGGECQCSGEGCIFYRKGPWNDGSVDLDPSWPKIQ
ncbi:cytosolic factor, phosphatidylinositol/phosphatidylcholine transfer protein [Kappamyces sp. JEL0680]|nr:cytosolic factor, phosphatidylinositol/phosphatidylcholine transfer protein [Kappamyces sp. JEL0680]